MIPYDFIYIVIAISCMVSVLTTVAIGKMYVMSKNDHICDHLKICWNILGKYRQVMPEEPQPLDAAMGHLQLALIELGATRPDARAPNRPTGVVVTELRDPDLD